MGKYDTDFECRGGTTLKDDWVYKGRDGYGNDVFPASIGDSRCDETSEMGNGRGVAVARDD